MSITYRRDYQELGLDETADWPAARSAYRRLVNTWHPDRYARRPRERDNAQQRFIRLTRSFDRLRAFHRENARLPFERVVPAAPEALRGDRVERVREERLRRAAPHVAVEGELLGDELLGRGAPARPGRGHGRRPERHLDRGPDARRGREGLPTLAWAAVALAIVGLTVVAFAVLDRSERDATYDGGREVLLDTGPSEFMPSATEVRRQSTRGTFVTREDGKLGDRLMEDLFR